ncbi:hypothetical protein [Shewanella sediminis]|uniref:hypothetical protein n=1 Tax=Shewanella sediminis TaxID=271097 RepID=UPI0002E4AC85|nr:hypothetical protein [Shewanella sediminis]
MSFLTPEHLIESAKNHLSYSKYWRGMGELTKADEQFAIAKKYRLQAAEMVRGL